MLNKRQEQILAVLSEKNQWITGKSLSAMMKVSDRTIRSDIETINREIEASPIESNVRLGYRIAGAYQGKTAEPGRGLRQEPRFPRLQAQGVFILFRSFCLMRRN